MIRFILFSILIIHMVSAGVRFRRQSNDPLWHMDHGMQIVGRGLAEMLTGERPPADLYSTPYEPFQAQMMVGPTERVLNNFQNPFDLFNGG